MLIGHCEQKMLVEIHSCLGGGGEGGLWKKRQNHIQFNKESDIKVHANIGSFPFSPLISLKSILNVLSCFKLQKKSVSVNNFFKTIPTFKRPSCEQFFILQIYEWGGKLEKSPNIYLTPRCNVGGSWSFSK